jgi:rhodanese-related sulfurtransferase
VKQKTPPYKQISQEEARKMMEEEDCVILDVRTEEEFNEGHIPDAVCLPAETIGSEAPAQLPDKDQVILIYCRTGIRAAGAAEQLAKLGYTNVYEFGGIVNWKGEIVKEESYDYGEPEASLTLEVSGRQIYTNIIMKKELLEAMGTSSFEFSFRDEGSVKRAVLPFTVSLEEKDTEVRTGDVLLCNGNEMILILEAGTVKGERIGNFTGMTKGELEEIFGEGDFTALMFLDWMDY